MRNRWLVSLLLGALAYAQAAKPIPPHVAHPMPGAQPMANANADAPPPESTLPPNEPVITIKGSCSDPAKAAETCQTVVTREQFEKLAAALQPNMSPAIKIRLANAYSKLIGMSNAAEKRKLDKTEKFELNLSFARMQVLSQQLTGTLQEEAGKVSDADMEKYYNEKIENYQEANLRRLFVPHTKQMPPPKMTPAKAGVKKDPIAQKEEAEAREKAAEEAMSTAAAALRARAAKGEDFDVLEREAYLAAGLKGNAPSTKMEKVRMTSLPPAHHLALQLRAGEVSEVISEPTGHYIYKLVSKQTLPLEQVKPEIKNWITTQRFRDVRKEVKGSTTMNEAYVGPLRGPKPPVQPGQSEPAQDVDPD